MVEREFKAVISEKTHETLIAALDTRAASSKVLHINYYFDTPDFFLHGKDSTLRVRQGKQSLKMQYKYNKHQVGSIRTSTEFDVLLQRLPLCIMSNELPNGSDMSGLYFGHVGSLATERLNYVLNGATISVDTNYYLGVCDYEIEIEHEESATINRILERLHLDTTSIVCTGKYNRFVIACKKHQKERSSHANV